MKHLILTPLFALCYTLANAQSFDDYFTSRAMVAESSAIVCC